MVNRGKNKKLYGQLVFDHECDVAIFGTINFFFLTDPSNSTIGPVSNSFGVSMSA